MADTPQTTEQPKRPSRKRRWRWLIVAIALVGSSIFVLAPKPGIDNRLVGKWHQPDRSVLILEENGFGQIVKSGSTPKSDPNLTWMCDGEHIVTQPWSGDLGDRFKRMAVTLMGHHWPTSEYVIQEYRPESVSVQRIGGDIETWSR